MLQPTGLRKGSVCSEVAFISDRSGLPAKQTLSISYCDKKKVRHKSPSKMMNSKAIMAIGLLVFGSLVVAYSCIVEPSGQLHASILTFWGESLTAMLLLHGIRKDK